MSITTADGTYSPNYGGVTLPPLGLRQFDGLLEAGRVDPGGGQPSGTFNFSSFLASDLLVIALIGEGVTDGDNYNCSVGGNLAIPAATTSGISNVAGRAGIWYINARDIPLEAGVNVTISTTQQMFRSTIRCFRIVGGADAVITSSDFSTSSGQTNIFTDTVFNIQGSYLLTAAYYSNGQGHTFNSGITQTYDGVQTGAGSGDFGANIVASDVVPFRVNYARNGGANTQGDAIVTAIFTPANERRVDRPVARLFQEDKRLRGDVFAEILAIEDTRFQDRGDPVNQNASSTISNTYSLEDATNSDLFIVGYVGENQTGVPDTWSCDVGGTAATLVVGNTSPSNIQTSLGRAAIFSFPGSLVAGQTSVTITITSVGGAAARQSFRLFRIIGGADATVSDTDIIQVAGQNTLTNEVVFNEEGEYLISVGYYSNGDGHRFSEGILFQFEGVQNSFGSGDYGVNTVPTTDLSTTIEYDRDGGSNTQGDVLCSAVFKVANDIEVSKTTFKFDGTIEAVEFDETQILPENTLMRIKSNEFIEVGEIDEVSPQPIPEDSLELYIDVLQGRSVVEAVGQQAFTASGTFRVPAGVDVISPCVLGGGGAGGRNASTIGAAGGGGGGVAYLPELSVFPLENIAVNVGSGGQPAASAGEAGGNGGQTNIQRSGLSIIAASGGIGGQGFTDAGNTFPVNGGTGGTPIIGVGANGGAGGQMLGGVLTAGGGGGAAAPGGNGGSGGSGNNTQAANGGDGTSGGAGGGAGGYMGNAFNYGQLAPAGAGGGTDLRGINENSGEGGVAVPGANQAIIGEGGEGGSGGGDGGDGNATPANREGGLFGGGGMGEADPNLSGAGDGRDGLANLIWGPGRQYPNTGIADTTSVDYQITLTDQTNNGDRDAVGSSFGDATFNNPYFVNEFGGIARMGFGDTTQPPSFFQVSNYNGVSGTSPRTLIIVFRSNNTSNFAIGGYGPYTSGSNGGSWILESNTVGGIEGFQLNISGATIRANIENETDVRDGNFHFVAASCGLDAVRDNVRLYLDGNEITDRTFTGSNFAIDTTSGSNIFLGATGTGVNLLAPNLLGDFAVALLYSVQLTNQQISDIYNTFALRGYFN